MRSERVLIVSADCHAGIPLERYRDYLDPGYRDDFDEYVAGVGEFALRAGSSRLSRERFLARYGDRIERAWDSQARLEDLQDDGVVAEVMFPGAGFKETAVPWSDIFGRGFGRNRTPRARELATAGEHAYNRWLAEFCEDTPGRRAGLAMVPLHDLDAAEAELRWGAEHGMRGVMFPVFNYDLPEYCDESYWEPFWSVCEEFGMGLHVHGGVGLPDFGRHTAALMGLELDYSMIRPFWHLVFSGVFDRHPDLQLVMTETTATFSIPQFLERMDAHFEGGGYGTVYKFSGACELRPSEYWFRQCHVGASIVARTQLDAREELGVGVLMFGSDYPHEEGTWGRTTEWLQASFGSVGVPEDETRAILGTNAVRLYRFGLDVLTPLAEQFGPTIDEVLTPADDETLSRLTQEFRSDGRPITGSNIYRPVVGVTSPSATA